MADPDASTDTEDTTDTEDPTTDTADEAAKWKSLARKHEKEAKALAGKVREFEDAGKTELERLTSRLSELEASQSPIRHENQRLRIALAKQLPADLVDRLRGDSEDELIEDAERLLALIGDRKSPPPSFDGGPRTPPPNGDGDMNAQIRRSLGRA